MRKPYPTLRPYENTSDADPKEAFTGRFQEFVARRIEQDHGTRLAQVAESKRHETTQEAVLEWIDLSGFGELDAEPA